MFFSPDRRINLVPLGPTSHYPLNKGIQYHDTRYAVCIPFIGQVVPGYRSLTCLQSTQCNRKMYNKYDKINVQYFYLNLLTFIWHIVYN